MIGRINEKEYIFNTLNGDFIFETKNWFIYVIYNTLILQNSFIN